MKLTATLLSILMSLGAAQSAFAADRDDLEFKTFRRIQRLEKILDRNIIDLTNSELKDINKKLKQSIDIALGKDPLGGGETQFIASVSFEESSTTIEANNLQDFIAQCESKAPDLSKGNVDDITARVSGGSKRSYHDGSGYQKTANQKCLVAAHLIILSANGSSIPISSKKYVLSGIAESYGFAASGNSLSELENSCIQNLKSSRFSVDDIFVNLNGGSKKTAHNGSSYWTNPTQICNQAISMVF